MRTRRVVVDLVPPPLPRRWLVLALLAAALPLSGQDQGKMQVLFPAPLGRPSQILTTGTGGAYGLTTLNRLGGTLVVGSAPPPSSATHLAPGAALAVNGTTVLGDNSAAALAAYGLGSYSVALTGPAAGTRMEDRSAGGTAWGLYATVNGGLSELRFWSNTGGDVLRVTQNGDIPMCKKMSVAYTFPAVTTCNNPGTGTAGYPFAVVAVNAANARIPVMSRPCKTSDPSCGPYGPYNIAGGYVVCCKFN